MHELPVTQSILDIALKHANKAEAKRITDLHIVMGELSKLVDESIQFYWDIIAKDTPAEGARLHFKRIPAEMLCLDCGNRFSPDEETLACPKCQSVKIKVAAGDEFRLDSITVDSDPVDREAEKTNAQKHTRS